MKTVSHLITALGLAVGLLFLLAAGMTAHATAAPQVGTAGETTLDGELSIGFVGDGPAVNTAGDGADPALAVPTGTAQPWVAYSSGDQVLVYSAAGTGAAAVWTQQGIPLGTAGAAARHPALALDPAGKAWAAWEESSAAGSAVRAAVFDGAAWSTAAVLNQDPQQDAVEPALAVGELPGEEQALPWAVWAEGAEGHTAIAAGRAISAAAPGGLIWTAAGQQLHVDAGAGAVTPDIAFAGSTPWVTWIETPTAAGARLYAARAVTDTGTPSGYRWQLVGAQEACLAAPGAGTCALGTNVTAAHIAGGQWSSEPDATPWVVFNERQPDGKTAVRVVRLDVGDGADPGDDRFIPVGGAANANCLREDTANAVVASAPDIHFVGSVPHIAWVERQAQHGILYVCHLIDLRPGQEEWDVDTLWGINRTASGEPAAPSLDASGTTPYVAWQEGSMPASIFVAHRQPDTPAWGRNYPPFIRIISGTFRLLLSTAVAISVPADQSADQTADQTAVAVAGAPLGPVRITTTCNHVAGWEHIEEIQFKLANTQQTIFVGKYVTNGDKVFVEDPDHSGVFLGGTPVGSGPSITTRYIELSPSAMAARQRGPGSPAREIEWVLAFLPPTFNQRYTQYLNIVYDSGAETGFFATGSVYVGTQLYLPSVQS